LDSEFATPYFKAAADVVQEFTLLARVEPAPLPAKSPEKTSTQMLGRPGMTSDAQRKTIARAFRRIECMTESEAIFEPSTRRALLVARSADPDGATPKSLLRDLRRYWQGGQTFDALRVHYAQCGGSGQATGDRGAKSETQTDEGKPASQPRYDDNQGEA
jgi:hypothetical protein